MAKKIHCKIQFCGPEASKERKFMRDAYHYGCQVGYSEVECEMLDGEIHFSSMGDAKKYLRDMWRYCKRFYYWNGDGITPDGKFMRWGNCGAEIVEGY